MTIARSLTLATMLMLTACAPTEASGDATVLVALADDEILLAPPSVPDGRIVFDTENTSTALVHEIEVFSGAIDGVLPPVANSVADTAGLTLIDEVEDIVPGASATLTIDLTPGTYLVICNLPAHFEAGMWAYLTVTG